MIQPILLSHPRQTSSGFLPSGFFLWAVYFEAPGAIFLVENSFHQKKPVPHVQKRYLQETLDQARMMLFCTIDGLLATQQEVQFLHIGDGPIDHIWQYPRPSKKSPVVAVSTSEKDWTTHSEISAELESQVIHATQLLAFHELVEAKVINRSQKNTLMQLIEASRFADAQTLCNILGIDLVTILPF